MGRIKAENRIGTIVNNFKILAIKKENGRAYYNTVCPVCQSEKWMRADTVNSGKAVSCGCFNKNNNYLKANNLKNMDFGRLKALEITENRDSGGSIIWKCKCKCDKICYVSAGDLKSQRVRSCGCLGAENSIENGKVAGKNVSENFCLDGTNVKNLTMRKSKRNTSGIKGVSWDKVRRKWVAQIKFKGRNYNLGRYPKIEEAAEIRQTAEKELFGDFLKWFSEEFPERWKKINKNNKG